MGNDEIPLAFIALEVDVGNLDRAAKMTMG
jgi:hypothetical protein